MGIMTDTDLTEALDHVNALDRYLALRIDLEELLDHEPEQWEPVLSWCGS